MPLSCYSFFSIFRLLLKYAKEARTGSVVEDNGESRKDSMFLQFRQEASMEGLSEAVVQFMVQFNFLVFFLFIAQGSSGGFFLTMGGIGKQDFLTEWGEFIS